LYGIVGPGEIEKGGGWRKERETIEGSARGEILVKTEIK
jgi:hypothetical protein